MSAYYDNYRLFIKSHSKKRSGGKVLMIMAILSLNNTCVSDALA